MILDLLLPRREILGWQRLEAGHHCTTRLSTLRMCVLVCVNEGNIQRESTVCLCVYVCVCMCVCVCVCVCV
jgi:hypothetical protein